jgi:broad specificity phosphatase PhoE
MKRIILVFVSFYIFSSILSCQDLEKIFTVYLVRHAEKVIDKDNLRNPELTECGQERAESLKNYFSQINLDRIYSTDYVRTRETAKPTAEYKDLDIEIYSPGNMEAIAEMILERGEDILIVGHSNTTPILAALLVDEQGYAIPDNVYNQIYQVVIIGDNRQLNIFYSAKDCIGK